MSQSPADPEVRRATVPSLGGAAAQGFSWLMAQQLATKAINLGAQILLAWLLMPEDFGLIGLAYTVTAFISVLQQAGLRDILVHRHTQFDRWANPVFWMSAWLGAAGTLLTLSAIPLATQLYGEPVLAGLLAVLSLNALLGGLTVVPEAKLSNALRFKTISLIAVASLLCNAVVACILAWYEFGAYAIAIGLVSSVLARLILLWLIAPHWPKRKMQVRRWRLVLGDGTAIMLTGILTTVVSQCDYVILGIFTSVAATGLYYFAFNLSLQTVRLFTLNLVRVLFPTLAKLQLEPERQMRSFIKASQLLAITAVPFCVLQAALADPVLRLLFDSKWEPAIPLLQILSLGMAPRLVAGPATSLMQSQGRFRLILVFTAVMATLFVILVVTVAALGGGNLGVACAVAGWSLVYGPMLIATATKSSGNRINVMLQIYSAPFLGSAIAIGAAAVLAQLVSGATVSGQLTQVLIVLTVSTIIYLPLIRWLAPDAIRDIRNRLHDLLSRGRAKASGVSHSVDSPLP